MSWDTAAGTTLGFSASAPATYDAEGFAALTYTGAPELDGFGEFGGEWSLVTRTRLSSRKVTKRKGSKNNGSWTVNLAFDSADAGQAILQAAEDSDDPISIKVTYDSGDVFYFEALVMSVKYGGNGSAEDEQTAVVSFELTENDPVLVAA